MITKILFICHGNICRSPMAEFVMKNLCREAGVEDRFEIASAAVSTEEIGNDIYPPAKRKLHEKGIPFGFHAARQITREDYEYYDYIICADSSNIRWLERLLGPDSENKVSLLMQWVDGRKENISDPWYTGDFEAAFRDVDAGCRALLSKLLEKKFA
ncbi:MAG: low molecular weight phosphotyrosine protein phosphatase [Paludibacteraceae bacterium]|nr:low molecular weight phosphotyrosine protein phosphatase [Paludibacteraceae bacterium]